MGASLRWGLTECMTEWTDGTYANSLVPGLGTPGFERAPRPRDVTRKGERVARFQLPINRTTGKRMPVWMAIDTSMEGRCALTEIQARFGWDRGNLRHA